jgi:hypothetical protein
LIRPLLPLFHGCKNARLLRRFLTENSFAKDAGINVLLEAQQLL